MSPNYYRPRMPFVVKNLIIINAIMLVVTMLAEPFMIKTFSLFYFGSPFFKPFQLITYMFMHGGFWHLFFNMFSLYMFGSVLENVWGPKKFFLYYMITGIGAGLVNELVMYLRIVILAYGMLFPNNLISFVFPPITLKAKWMVLIFGAIELLTGVTGTTDNVAHFAHLGGMIFGLILILFWKKKGRLYS